MYCFNTSLSCKYSPGGGGTEVLKIPESSGDHPICHRMGGVRAKLFTSGNLANPINKITF